MKALKYIAGIAAATVIALGVVTYISASEKDTNNSESKIMLRTDWFPGSVAGAIDPFNREEQLLIAPSSATLAPGCDPDADDTEPTCSVRFDLSNVPSQNLTLVEDMIDDIEYQSATYNIQQFLDLGVSISEEPYPDE